MNSRVLTPYVQALKALGYSYEHDKNEMRFFRQNDVLSSTIICFDFETKTVSKYRDVYADQITMDEFNAINDILKHDLEWI